MAKTEDIIEQVYSTLDMNKKHTKRNGNNSPSLSTEGIRDYCASAIGIIEQYEHERTKEMLRELLDISRGRKNHAKVSSSVREYRLGVLYRCLQKELDRYKGEYPNLTKMHQISERLKALENLL